MAHDLTIEDIHRLRETGKLDAMMHDQPRYLLFAYQVYPNGTTADLHEQDPEIARKIGAKTGLGDPTDPLGWAIWDIGPIS